MKTLFYYEYEVPIGRIVIAEEGGAITFIEFGKESIPQIVEGGAERETSIIGEAYRQLKEYFSGSRKTFDLPLAPKGTDFQQSAWQALLTIPYGETRSYKEIAEQIGNPKACRAVGMANNRNPISIVVPCHRVIGSNGSLVGYGGGLDIKKQLLDLERKFTGSDETGK